MEYPLFGALVDLFEDRHGLCTCLLELPTNVIDKQEGRRPAVVAVAVAAATVAGIHG